MIAPATSAHETARALVLAHGWNAASYQILNPGMRLWFADRGDAVVGYVRHRSTIIVAGAPVCAHERLESVTREFHSHADSGGARVLYFGAGERLERLLKADGRHHLLRLGAQPNWSPNAWPTVVRTRASLRAQLHRARNKGVRVEELAPADVSRHLVALRSVLARWLERPRGRG